MTPRCLAFLLALAAVAGPAAQTPAPTAAPPPAAADLPRPPADFEYRAAGRRDPFLSLSRSGTVPSAPAPSSRPSGVAGLLVDELMVRGIVQSQGAYVAMVSGAAGQTFTVRTGSRLFDGTVRTITPQEVVIVQQVVDPLSLQKQREVRKPLRTQEEGK